MAQFHASFGGGANGDAFFDTVADLVNLVPEAGRLAMTPHEAQNINPRVLAASFKVHRRTTFFVNFPRKPL